MTAVDVDKCDVKWCHEPIGHADVHRQYLGEIMLHRQGISSISVTLEAAHDEPRPQLVFTIATTPAGYRSATLEWRQVDDLAEILACATARWSRT